MQADIDREQAFQVHRRGHHREVIATATRRLVGKSRD
jgi:hypothetical protein